MPGAMFFCQRGFPAGLNPNQLDRYCPQQSVATWEELGRYPLTREEAGALARDRRLTKLAQAIKDEGQALNPVLIHNDICPANIGLPRAKKGKVVLLDWQLAEPGPGPIDLGGLNLNANNQGLALY